MLWELTALPQVLYLDFRGPTSKERVNGRGGKGEGGERRGTGKRPRPHPPMMPLIINMFTKM